MYKIIVIGGGHAGIEAALASARLGNKTLLVTGSIDSIGHLPCNPSIGGPAKGIVVREIDALGGQMGKTIDKTYIQMKMLNSSKGPAVHALRAQADIIEYPKEMQRVIKTQENLDIKEAYVEKLLVEDDKVCGVVLENSEVISGEAIIITTGTYLQSKVMRGEQSEFEGPSKQRVSMGLSEDLRKHGIRTFRLKTGTPARIKSDSIDYALTTIQLGDQVNRNFSFTKIEPMTTIEEQLPCYLTYTTKEAHDIINQNLYSSSMYSGLVEGVGPRYCPSIETKIERFSDKERHQIFLEPESRHTDSVYIQGYSNSMPIDIQEKMLRAIPALKNCEVITYAYAIEYDAIRSTDLYPSLESKKLDNLFFAGQINGTSGYEEAAAQGLIAGINASRKINKQEALILSRDEAYIGVLIDDLVTKGTDEPYRLLTSRAEFRLLLRHDNADTRLTDIGYEVGLISKKEWTEFKNKEKKVADEIERLKTLRVYPKKDTLILMEKMSIRSIKEPATLYELLKRDEVRYDHVLELLDEKSDFTLEMKYQLELFIKYEGYITKAKKESESLKKLENYKIPSTFNYNAIHNLAFEAKEKLSEIKPLTIGQAQRIPGINPSDIQTLLVVLRGGK